MILVAKLSVIKRLHSIKNSELCSLFLFVRKLFISVAGLIMLTACQPAELVDQKQKWVYSGPIMGTQYRVTVIDRAQLTGVKSERQAHIENTILDAMNRVNQSMSTYIADSELNQFNALPANEAMTVSRELKDVMAEALLISEISGGAFDVTLADAVNLWGFGPDGKISRAPSEQTLLALTHVIGYQKLNLQANKLSKSVEGVHVDLSAIAKGYAVDQVARGLESLGINDYLVDIGGELRAAGVSNNGQAWRVGVEKPHVLGGIQEVIELNNKAIATSGDYRNYHLIDGKHYSHTINAKTLRPVFHRLALVSVISENTSTADGLATAIMAMGEEAGFNFARKNNLIVYMVVRGAQEDEYEIKMTPGFHDYLQ